MRKLLVAGFVLVVLGELAVIVILHQHRRAVPEPRPVQPTQNISQPDTIPTPAPPEQPAQDCSQVQPLDPYNAPAWGTPPDYQSDLCRSLNSVTQ